MLPSSGSVAVAAKEIDVPDEKLELFAGLVIVTVGGASTGGGGVSSKADGAHRMPSRSRSNVYSASGESFGAVPRRIAFARIRVRAVSGARLSPRLISFSHMRDTTPATCGEAILDRQS